MPTYEYRCTACDHVFEEFQSIKAEPLTVCPKCSGEVKRVIGPGAGFIFKGSGFYITDYTRSKDYKEKSKSDAGGKKPETKGSEGGAPSGGSGSGGGGSKSEPAAPPASEKKAS